MLFAWQEEGIQDIRPLIDDAQLDEALKQTLLCFVLVAPNSAHVFCSRYDFGPWPLLPGVTSMPPSAWQVLNADFAALHHGSIRSLLTTFCPHIAILQAVELYVQFGAMPDVISSVYKAQHTAVISMGPDNKECTRTDTINHFVCMMAVRYATHVMDGSIIVGVNIRKESRDTLRFIS